MNEILFLTHVIVVGLFALGALRFGKEALTAWVAIQALCANLFVLKQMTLFSFEVTCSDVFAIGSILGLNLLQEYFGKESAKRGMNICFFFLLFFGLMSQIHLFYQPSPHDWSQAAFAQLLSPAPRLLLASLATFFLVQQFDIRLFGALKNRFPKLPLSVRNGFSLSVSQLLDTALFTFLGLYGIASSLGDIIAVSFLVKLLLIACLTPFITFSKRVVHV